MFFVNGSIKLSRVMFGIRAPSATASDPCQCLQGQTEQISCCCLKFKTAKVLINILYY